MNLDKFDWGTSSEWFFKTINKEIFEERIYERFFEVEKDDIVMDIGASIGPFPFSIIEKKPKKIICFEPSFEEFPTLVKNTLHGNVYCINKGISSVDGEQLFNDLYGQKNSAGIAHGITFKQVIDDFNLDKIDFLKTDCEGGEYSIFNDENLEYIQTNIKKIVGEWHLLTAELKTKFINFRDNYLVKFTNYEVYSIDGVNIKWDLFNENFMEYYTEVIIYIDNR